MWVGPPWPYPGVEYEPQLMQQRSHARSAGSKAPAAFVASFQARACLAVSGVAGTGMGTPQVDTQVYITPHEAPL